MTDTTAFRVADLPQNAATEFDLRPTDSETQSIAAELGLSGLRKLRFTGRIVASGTRDWRLEGRLGATVVQPCVVTLSPVTTRIDAEVSRRYLADWVEPTGDEVEMPDDDSIEPLGRFIDPAAVMAEALALAIPVYPRADGAELGDAVYAEPGTAPLRDVDVKPFSGLAALRDSLKQ